MATVSGYLRFDKQRAAISSSSMSGIANVPIVLQNTATNQMLTVYTDANGMYTFTNVPNGNYRIVEAYGASAVPSPGNFLNATVGSTATAAFPPISYAPGAPADATNLDATTTTTRFVTVNGNNLTNQDILNGPVKYTPIQTTLDTGVSIVPGNLITNAAGGTFGSFSPGTAPNTGANPNPYTNIGSQFIYTQPNPFGGVVPGPGRYTIQNTMTNATAAVQNTWWRISDHTSGNETGRMMIVNGDNPGRVLFQQQVAVKPDTYYLFSAWILNLAKNSSLLDPALGVQVLDQNGNAIYNATLGALIPMDPDTPEWKQIGTVLNSKNNTSLTVRFTSMGPEADGNDYAIDDIALNEIQIAAYPPKKSADVNATHVGDVVTYTVTLHNTGGKTLTNISIQDSVPDGFTFVPGSVTVNGTRNPNANPNTGFAAPDIPGGNTLTVTFQAVANKVPATNPTKNRANASYAYSPIDGGIPDVVTKPSNDVNIRIDPGQADLSVIKTADKNPALNGGTLTYTLAIRNNGPNVAQNVTLSDIIPAGLQSPQYSADGGVTWLPWNGSAFIGNFAPGTGGNILIRGTVSESATGTMTNTATVSSPTADPNQNNNSSTVLTPITSLADLSVVKTADKSPVQTGDLLTYTLTAHNSGPNNARNVTITDIMPGALQSPEYSLDGGATWQPWTGSYNQSTLANGANVSILLRGTVSGTATGTLTNTATISSPTPDPNKNNNGSTVLTPIANRADLSMTKLCDKNPVPAGDVLTYTLTAQNNGPDAARDITITDTAPAGLLSPEYSTDGGVTWQPWNGSYTLSMLGPNASASIKVRGTVNSTATGVITNTATVSSKTPDPNPDNNSHTVLTPIINQADLSMIKTEDKNPVVAGDVLTYIMTVQNNGPNTARDVTFTDPVPGAVTSPEVSTDGGATWQPWTGTLPLNSLAPGASVTIRIRGTVNEATTGILTNTATVSSPTPDPNHDNNSGTSIVPVVNQADLSVTKTAIPNPAQEGAGLTYILTTHNTGPNTARSATLTDTLPAALRSAEYSTDGGVTWQPWTGSAALGDIASGADATVLIRGTVDPAAIGVLNNTAAVRSNTPDPNTDNNTTNLVTPINTAADLSVTKRADKSPVQAGDVLTYSLTAHNNGPNDALNTIVSDATPGVLRSPEYSLDGGATWQPWTRTYNAGTLAANATLNILIRGTVDPGTTGLISNIAGIRSDTPDPNLRNNRATIFTPVNTAADLAVTKTADKSTAIAGDVVQYTVTATNNGPNDAENAAIDDTPPNGLVSPEYSTDGGVTWQPWTGSYPLGTLTPGASAAILIRGTVADTFQGVLANTAAVSSITPDPIPDNNRATASTAVTALADIAIKKTGDKSPVHAGDTLTYTLAVQNNGPNAANDIQITDNIPPDLTGTQYSADGGATWQPWLGAYTLGNLPPGGSATILVRGTVSNTASGVIVNTATASSATLDPNPNNNSDTVITPVTLLADLSVTKTGDKSPVTAGDTLTYTLTATNNGPNDATNVSILDNVPLDLSNAMYSTDGGVTWRQWRGGFTWGSLAAGASDTILIRGTVSNTANGVITNAATVTSPTPDPNAGNNSDTVITPVVQSADMALTKSTDKETVQVGDLLTYTLSAVNNGPNSAEAVIVMEELPASFLSPEYSTDGGVTWQPWTGDYEAGVLAPGEKADILLRGRIEDSGAGVIVNTATVSSQTPDPNPDNNNDTVLTPTVTSADLSLTKTSDKTEVKTGDILTYTLTVTNNGPNTADELVTFDDLPEELLPMTYSTDGGVTWQPFDGTYATNNLAPGDSFSILVRGRSGVSADGVITNTATVSSQTPDPNPDNNSNTVLITVPEETPDAADLVIQKTADQSEAYPGDILTYTLSYINNGPNAAENVTITDATPENLSNPEYSVDNGVTWLPWNGQYALNTLNPGTGGRILIRGTVSQQGGETFSNTADIQSQTPDPDPSNNTSTALTPILKIPECAQCAGLVIKKTVCPCSLYPCDTVVYTLEIVNRGPGIADNIVVTDRLPDEICNAIYSIDYGRNWHTWHGSGDFGTLAPGCRLTIIIKGIIHPCASGTICNRAVVCSSTKDCCPENNKSYTSVKIRQY